MQDKHMQTTWSYENTYREIMYTVILGINMLTSSSGSSNKNYTRPSLELIYAHILVFFVDFCRKLVLRANFAEWRTFFKPFSHRTRRINWNACENVVRCPLHYLHITPIDDYACQHKKMCCENKAFAQHLVRFRIGRQKLVAYEKCEHTVYSTFSVIYIIIYENRMNLFAITMQTSTDRWQRPTVHILGYGTKARKAGTRHISRSRYWGECMQ